VKVAALAPQFIIETPEASEPSAARHVAEELATVGAGVKEVQSTDSTNETKAGLKRLFEFLREKNVQASPVDDQKAADVQLLKIKKAKEQSQKRNPHRGRDHERKRLIAIYQLIAALPVGAEAESRADQTKGLVVDCFI
jgi:hypothetical protein